MKEKRGGKRKTQRFGGDRKTNVEIGRKRKRGRRNRSLISNIKRET